jgi:hypothetical protein
MLFVLAALATGAAVLTAACNFTMTVPKPPVYAESMDSLRAQVRGLVSCEHFDVAGSETTTNGKKRTELKIDIVNGQDVPQGNSMWVLGRSVASILKRALKDTAEYETYRVGFTREEKSGMSFSSQSEFRTFLSKDL